MEITQPGGMAPPRSAALGGFLSRFTTAPWPTRRRTPRAAGLTGREVRALLDRMMTAMDPALEYEIRHEDCTIEFPQSGERFTRDGLRRMQEAFPGGAPDVRLRRLTGGGEVWTSECVVRYTDGTVAHGVDIIEFRDGKVWKETRYFGEPFEPPSWRAALNAGAGPYRAVRPATHGSSE